MLRRWVRRLATGVEAVLTGCGADFDGFLPPATERHHQLLLPALQLVVGALVSFGAETAVAARHVRSLSHPLDLGLPFLRDRLSLSSEDSARPFSSPSRTAQPFRRWPPSAKPTLSLPSLASSFLPCRRRIS